MLTSIGGVTVCAIRLGREDKEGANNVFLHSLTLNFLIATMIAGSTLCVLISVVFARPIGTLFGAEGEVLDFTEFWNEKNPDPNMPSDFVGDGNEGMFRFQKKMKN